MRSGVYKSSRKRRRKQIAECVPLLKHARNYASSLCRAIFKSGSRSVTVKTTHGDTEEGTDSEEGVIVGDETGSKLEDDEKQVVDDERPESELVKIEYAKQCRPTIFCHIDLLRDQK